MERLAKEKIAKKQQILILRRQLSARFDNIDSTIHLPEVDGNDIRERGKFCKPIRCSFDQNEININVCFFLLSFLVSSESLSEQSLSGRVRYGSTSSLSSAATASSPCAAGVPVSFILNPS